MSHTRYIKPDFFKDEDIADLEYYVRLLYIGLWTLADKEGRLEYRPKRIQAELFPYDTKIDIIKGLEKLCQNKNNSKKPYIYIYGEFDNQYLQIINWHKYQKPHFTEKESIIPIYNNINNNLKINLKSKASSSDIEVNEQLVNVEVTVNKKNYSEFVKMTEIEYDKMIEKIGETKTKEMIERLNNYIGSKGKKYHSHYHTILNWVNKDNVSQSEVRPNNTGKYVHVEKLPTYTKGELKQ